MDLNVASELQVLQLSACAAPLCTFGLTVMRQKGLCPRRFQVPEDGHDPDLFENFLWFFCCFRLVQEKPNRWYHRLLDGALCLFALLAFMGGLMLRQLPLLGGWSSQGLGMDMHKAAGMVLSTQVLLCMFAERCWILGEPLSSMQCASGFCIWFACTLVEYAGPRPMEHLSTILEDQVASCDGGWRSPFQFYVSLWATVLVFGLGILLVPEHGEWVRCCGGGDGGSRHQRSQSHDSGQPLMCDRGDDDEDVLPDAPAEPCYELSWEARRSCAVHAMRRKWLPVVYGVATSMSSVVFAVGASRRDHFWLGAGVVLTAVAAFCALTWLRRMDMPLSTWAFVSQGNAMLAKLIQDHLLFRNFQWDPEGRTGALAVQKMPGVQLFMLGIALMVLVLWFFDVSSAWCESWAPEKSEHKAYADSRQRVRKISWNSLFQWLLFLACAACLIVGISEPLIQTRVVYPQVQYLQGDAAVDQFRNATHPWHEHMWSHSYSQLLTLHYENHMPFSAMAAAYTSVLMPALLFSYLILVLVRPSFLSEEVILGLKRWIVHKAPYRFVTPMVLMTTVSLVNLSDPGGATFQATFTRGIYYYMAYCFIVNVLALSVEACDDAPASSPPASESTSTVGSRRSMESRPSTTLSSRVATRESSGTEASVHAQDMGALGGTDRWLLEEANGKDMRGGAGGLGRHERELIMEVETQEGDSAGGDPPSDEDFNEDKSEVPSEEGSTSAEDNLVCPSERSWTMIALPFFGLSLFIGVGCAMVFVFQEPLIRFEMRLSDITVLKSHPSILQIWKSLLKASPGMAVFAAATLVLSFPLWVLFAGLRVGYGEKDPQDPFCTPACIARSCERILRPFVQIHIWAFSVVILYVSVTSRNKEMHEVCFHLPRMQVVCIILGLGALMFGVLSIAAKQFSFRCGADREDVHEAGPRDLPGGYAVWGIAPMACCGTIFVGMFVGGPLFPAQSMRLEAVNKLLQESFLPAANLRIPDYIPEDRGDCEALWNYRVSQGEASAALWNESAIYQDCVGHSPLTHVMNRKVDATALWATGLNTLQLKDIHLEEPVDLSADSQLWKMTFSGMFRDMNIWTKVMLSAWGETPWLDDYMCCDKNFNFTVEVRMPCHEGRGFQRARLKFLHVDKPELKHSTCSDETDSSFCMEWVYGKADSVDPNLNEALGDFLSGKTGQLLMKTSDSTIVDLLEYVSSKLTDVVRLNTGDWCPHNLF